MPTLTLPPVTADSLSIGVGGIAGAVGVGASYYATSAKSISKTDMTSGKITIQGTNPDIVIGDKSMKHWMEKVEARLAILEPKKELLEKYEALQQAYSHYLTLEALLHEEE